MAGKKNPRFHSSDSSYAEYRKRCITTGVSSGKITERDADLITNFVLENGSGCSPGRKYKMTHTLVSARQFVPAYENLTLSDLLEGIDSIKTDKKPDGSDLFTRNTQIDYIRAVKRFVLWLVDEGIIDIPEKKIRSTVKTPAYRSTKTNEEMLTEEEIRNMLEECTNARDRALISMLYEGAFRLGEIADMKWSQITFNDWSAQVVIAGESKTGINRYVPLVSSRQYLAVWKDHYYTISKTDKFREKYPEGMTQDSFLFLTNNRYQPLHYNNTAKHIRLIATRAGVTKHVTPHIFRHSRITHMLQQGVNESIIKLIAWGHQDTDMLATYGHLCDRDTDKAMAELAGIKLESTRTKKKTLEPLQCSRCQFINSPTSRFCNNCGLELSKEAIDEVNIAKQQAEMLPEYKLIMKEFEEKIKNIQFSEG
ncbi:hypothetical protein JCM10550A_21130 [Methanogenium cariaci]|jgi:integrase/recombinase XerD